MRKLVALSIICLIATALSFAQSTTDGAIGGTVFDKTGAVVGGATIVVHNVGTDAEQTVNADGSGNYRVPGLQPGTYTVTITGGRLAAYKAQQVIVEVGSLTEVSPKLGVSGTNEVVDVTAEAPQINYTSPDFANTLNDTAISNLPINGGRWSNFALLTPTVVNTPSGFGLLSFRGISSLLNNNTVDGADNNQAFFSEERGRTRIGYSTPKAAVEEFQVNTSNYSAEYGRSAGGVINTVSKSGTNQIHGEMYFYDRDNDWGAANAFTQINVQTPSGFTSQNFKPTDWRKMAGFGAGGPLIKDKLFLFVAYDWYHRNFPGVAVASNPNVFFAAPSATSLTTFAQRLNGLPGSGAGSTPSAAQLAAAQTTYSNDLAGLNTLLGQVPRNGEQTIWYPKLDWNINSKNHASFSLNRMRWASPAGIQTASTVTRGVASFGNDFVKETWGVAKLDTFFTSNFSNQVRFQYGRDYEFEFSQPPAPYEVANIVNKQAVTNPLGPLPPTVSITNGFTFGVPNFLQRSRFPDESRVQVADTMTWNHGKHTIKYGADVSHVNDNSQNLFNGFGSYSYSTLIDYFSDLNVARSCSGGTSCYSSFSQGLGLPGLEFRSNDYAFFAADDWKILPRLSLSFGLRYEYEQLPKPFANLVNPAVPQTERMPADKNNFGPRVGFAAQLTKDGKTVLRGGYGIYYGRIINSTIFNALIDTAAAGSQVSKSLQASATGAPTFPNILTNPSGTASNVVFFAPNFQNPQIHQMDLTLEREIGWNTVFRMSYLGSLGRELPGFADTNIAPSSQTVTYAVLNGGPVGASTITEPLFLNRANPALGSTTEIFSGINSRYDAFVVQFDHRLSHSIQFSASYTRSRSIDFGQNESTFSDTNDLLLPITVPGAIKAEKAAGIYDTPYRIVANAVATSPWKVNGWAGWLANNWEFSPIYQIQSGLPFSLTTAGTPGMLTTTGGTNKLVSAIGSSINGSGGANRIDATGRDTFRNPGAWVTDLRLGKRFKFQERYELELTGDFFNIANKQNVTNINNTGYIISNPSVKNNVVSPCATGVPTTESCLTFSPTFGSVTNSNSSFAYTPRQIQLGVRVKF